MSAPKQEQQVAVLFEAFGDPVRAPRNAKPKTQLAHEGEEKQAPPKQSSASPNPASAAGLADIFASYRVFLSQAAEDPVLAPSNAKAEEEKQAPSKETSLIPARASELAKIFGSFGNSFSNLPDDALTGNFDRDRELGAGLLLRRSIGPHKPGRPTSRSYQLRYQEQDVAEVVVENDLWQAFGVKQVKSWIREAFQNSLWSGRTLRVQTLFVEEGKTKRDEAPAHSNDKEADCACGIHARISAARSTVGDALSGIESLSQEMESAQGNYRIAQVAATVGAAVWWLPVAGWAVAAVGGVTSIVASGIHEDTMEAKAKRLASYAERASKAADDLSQYVDKLAEQSGDSDPDANRILQAVYTEGLDVQDFVRTWHVCDLYLQHAQAFTARGKAEEAQAVLQALMDYSRNKTLFQDVYEFSLSFLHRWHDLKLMASGGRWAVRGIRSLASRMGGGSQAAKLAAVSRGTSAAGRFSTAFKGMKFARVLAPLAAIISASDLVANWNHQLQGTAAETQEGLEDLRRWLQRFESRCYEIAQALKQRPPLQMFRMCDPGHREFKISDIHTLLFEDLKPQTIGSRLPSAPTMLGGLSMRTLHSQHRFCGALAPSSLLSALDRAVVFPGEFTFYGTSDPLSFDSHKARWGSATVIRSFFRGTRVQLSAADDLESFCKLVWFLLNPRIQHQLLEMEMKPDPMDKDDEDEDDEDEDDDDDSAGSVSPPEAASAAAECKDQCSEDDDDFGLDGAGSVSPPEAASAAAECKDQCSEDDDDFGLDGIDDFDLDDFNHDLQQQRNERRHFSKAHLLLLEFWEREEAQNPQLASWLHVARRPSQDAYKMLADSMTSRVWI